jgi:sporulation protein YlmC with PRC-barrel domain
MATSTLVQYLETSGVSVSGAVTQVGLSASNRQQFETFLCETAITKGNLVAIDVTAAKLVTDPSGGLSAATVITADFNAAGTVQKIVVGIAAETVTGTATSPQPVKVIVRGPAPLVPVVAATAVGDPLILDSAGAAGSAQVAAAATTTHVFAYAMTSTAGAGTVTAYVLGCGI